MMNFISVNELEGQAVQMNGVGIHGQVDNLPDFNCPFGRHLRQVVAHE